MRVCEDSGDLPDALRRSGRHRQCRCQPALLRRGRGLTWLNYLNDQVAGPGGIVVPGTVRDSLHILDGIYNLDGG